MTTTKLSTRLYSTSYRIVGILYLASGLWCAINPTLSASFLGINFQSEMGLAEFFSVYGGLQVGIGCAMILSSFYKPYLEGAVFFAAIVSTGLIGFRLIAVPLFSSDTSLLGMAVLEALIAVLLWRYWYLMRSQNMLLRSENFH